MDASAYAELFAAEAREHLVSLDHGLIALENEPDRADPLEEVFRAVHSLKGMAAALGHQRVARLAHAAEHLLDALRRGQPVTPDALELLFEAADALRGGVERAVAATGAATGAAPGRDGDADGADDRGLRERLERAVDGAPVAGRMPGAAAAGAAEADMDADAAGEADSATTAAMASAFGTLLRVRVVPDPEGELPGARLFLAFQQALQLGAVRDAAAVEARLRGGDDGPLELLLETERGPAEVRRRLGGVGEIRRVEVQPAAAAEPADPAVDAASAARVEAGGRAAYIRVRQDRLDALLDQAGELVLLRDRLRELVGPDSDPALGEAVEQASRLIGEMRDEVMRVRMVPVWQVLERLPRLVRDAARSLGKQVRFEIEGREVELDRALLDELRDPLVHLLRNAVDHGLEPPDERRTAGKPPAARVQLRVQRERGGVRIEVSDDGRGIHHERVRRVAVERGLLAESEAAVLGPDALLQLLVRPGFSTAEQVTELSGRGVGLDVVAARLRSLGGTLEVQSEPGSGTTFSLRLPLSLTLVRALLVRAAGAIYALPLGSVLETAEVDPARVEEVGRARLLRLREHSIPLVALHRILQATDVKGAPEPLPVVVVGMGARRLALAVDQLCGQQEVVVKPFDATTGTVPVFLGATILSDARPALVVDVPSLMARTENRWEE